MDGDGGSDGGPAVDARADTVDGVEVDRIDPHLTSTHMQETTSSVEGNGVPTTVEGAVNTTTDTDCPMRRGSNQRSSSTSPTERPGRRQSSAQYEHAPASMILTTLATHVHEFPGLAEDVRKEYIRTVSVQPLKTGFGFTFATTQDRSPPEMVHVKAGGAAETAGILVGDRIVSVGDFMSVFSSHSEVVELIRAASGPDNDAVSLTLLRKDVPRTTLVPASPESGSESEMASCGPFGFEIDPPSEDLSSVEPSEMESPQARDGEAAVGGERSASSVSTSVTPVHTSSAQRRKWVSFLKTVNSTMVEPVWHVPDDTGKFAPGEHCAKFGTKPEYCLPVNDTTTALVAAGVPHNLRRQVWLRSCGAAAGSGRVALRYDEIALCAAEQLMGTETASQIEKDLLRTFPTNVYFSEMDREGTRRLRRVLTTAAWTLPDIGYCQGMGMIAAMLLLVLEEAEAYWAFRAVVVKLLPVDYFSSTLIGAMADQRVLADLIEVNENRVFKVMKTHGIELSLITMSWFLTAFCTIAPLHTTLRIWDFFLLEGSVVLFKVALAMITLRASFIASMEDSGELFNSLSETPSFMNDPDRLLQLAFSFMHIEQELPALRKRHTKDITAEVAVMQKRRQELADSRGSSPGSSGNTSGGEAAKSPAPASSPTWIRKRMGIFGSREKGTSPRFGRRKTKSRVQSKLLMAVSHAVHDLVVHMQELVDEEDEEEQERLRLRAHVVDYISEKEGGLADDDQFETPRHGSIAGDARKNPMLAELIKGTLFEALNELLEAGLQVPLADDADSAHDGDTTPPSGSVWDFCRDICRGDSEFDWEASSVPETIRESYETMVAAVTSIDLSPIPSEDSAFLQLFCKGLNAGLIEDWVDVLAYAASQSKFKHFYDSSAHIRTKAVKIQVKEDLRRLKQYTFNVI